MGKIPNFLLFQVLTNILYKNKRQSFWDRQTCETKVDMGQWITLYSVRASGVDPESIHRWQKEKTPKIVRYILK